MKFPFKPKPLGVLFIGWGIGFVGAIAKIYRENYADTILAISLFVEFIGIIIFCRWYVKMRKIEKKISISNSKE